MFARQRYGVDEAFLGERRAAGAFEFGVEESPVELGVVRDDWSVSEKLHQAIDHVWIGEALLVAQKFIAEACDTDRGFTERFFGIDVDLKFAAGLDVVVQFYTSDFDDSFSVAGLEPCGFGVECDFPHVSSVSAPVSPEPRMALRISSTCTPA